MGTCGYNKLILQRNDFVYLEIDVFVGKASERLQPTMLSFRMSVCP